jgi:RNA polymerase sigma-70 factor (ECF subfamily)
MGKVSFLLAKVAEGNRDALGDVLELFQKYLHSIARREIAGDLQSKGGASDLVQETFLDAQQSIESFKGRSEPEFLAWLRTLMLHNLSNFHRRYRSTARRSVAREVSGASNYLAVSETSPAGAAEQQDQLQLLSDLIQQLPTDHNRVLKLWYEEKSFEEIGGLMGRSTNAARMLWMRAVQRLQEMIANTSESDTCLTETIDGPAVAPE